MGLWYSLTVNSDPFLLVGEHPLGSSGSVTVVVDVMDCESGTTEKIGSVRKVDLRRDRP